MGQAKTEATLTVHEPQEGIQPWFITKPKSSVSSPGQNVVMSCAISGDPFPRVQWLKDGRTLHGRDILQSEDVFTLILRNVQESDSGVYEITLKNAVGESSCQVSLMVQESLGSRSLTQQREQQHCVEGDGWDEGDALSPGRTPEGDQNIRGVLKRRVDIKENTEEKLRQQEAEQLDFRKVLGKKVKTRKVLEEEIKDVPAEQMDFRANLQRQVKPKAEDERKVNNTQQVDFRSVLGKKPSTPKTSQPDKTANKVAAPDFRSVLSPKKKGPTENGNMNNIDPQENAKPAAREEKTEVNCCSVVDGEIDKDCAQSTGEPPAFTEKLQDVRLVDGEKLVLRCKVSSDPPATITWTLDGKIIKSSKFILLTQE
ncbi:hypothetical protein GDO86_018280, partial [Hymenochirus boettgeri]